MNVLLQHRFQIDYKHLVKRIFFSLEKLKISDSRRVKLLLLNFQFNMMVSLRSDIFAFIEDFFQVIVRNYDDFDIEVTRAAGLMNSFVQEQITIRSKTFRANQIKVLREVLKSSERWDNYQVGTSILNF